MRFVGLMIAALALAAAASQPSGGTTAPNTSLTIVALNERFGRAVFQLTCEPDGGDVPVPITACWHLNREPELVTSPEPFMCRGGPGSHWFVEISGRLKGVPLSQSFTTCWTLQAPLLARFGLTWEILEDHLVLRRRKSVRLGTTRRFAPGVLRAADLVTCKARGRRLELGVPIQPGTWATLVSAAVLNVAHNPDGSVTASCRRVRRR